MLAHVAYVINMTGHAPGQARGGAHRYMDVPCIALSGAIRGTSLDPSYVPCKFYIDIYSTWDTATFLAILDSDYIHCVRFPWTESNSPVHRFRKTKGRQRLQIRNDFF